MDARFNLSRTFFGKPLCVYCEGIADTKDHAPPRCLLRIPIGNEARIFTFPACSACNRSFSPDENLFKAVLAAVSFEPDLIAEAHAGGAVYRALERDNQLRALIQIALQLNGVFQLSPAILSPMFRVITKTVQGLYFAAYGKVLCAEEVSIISANHARQKPPEDVARALRRSSTADLSAGAWPEVRPNPRRLAKGASLWPDGVENDLMQPVEWIDIQPGAFRFAFFRGEEGRAICLMDIRSTIVAAASCPWPADRGPIRKGRNQKYSRDVKAKLRVQ